MNSNYDIEQGLLSTYFDQVPERLSITIDNKEIKKSATSTKPIEEKLPHIEMAGKPLPKALQSKSARFFDCHICFQSQHIVQMMPLACAHEFCRTCFESYVRQMILQRRIRTLMCPFEGCDNEITEDFIKGLSKDLGQSYLYAKQFISPNLRRCVGKDCEKFLEGSVQNPHIICECGAEVCFDCGAEWHENYTCQQFLEEELENDEQKNKIKLCPQCKIRVMKLEGCDHITCYVCKSEWCWVCLVNKFEGHALSCKYYGGQNQENAQEPNQAVARQPGVCKAILCFIFQILMGTVMCALLPFAFVIYCLGWPAFTYCFEKLGQNERPSCIIFILLFLLGMISLPLVLLMFPLALAVAIIFGIIMGIIGLGALAMMFFKLPAVGAI